MNAPEETSEQTALWLVEEWGRHFTTTLESMSDAHPATVCDGTRVPFAPSGEALNYRQEFSLGPEFFVRISIPEWLWREAGSRVLRAAGIDEVGDEDARSTFLEILSQAFSSVATSIGERLKQEVTCGPRSELEIPPDASPGLALRVTFPDGESPTDPIIVALEPRLSQVLNVGQPVASAPEEAAAPVRDRIESPAASSMSKTFDLLLGVNLPISVSFGKTSMMVKEVLKLTTGSIVELDRTVTEPVDIIVNNCIIARGDVVVVGGNYGVRVREIVSREERYETSVRASPVSRV
jgi:flagellar motor switch protein FliN/FliY